MLSGKRLVSFLFLSFSIALVLSGCGLLKPFGTPGQGSLDLGVSTESKGALDTAGLKALHARLTKGGRVVEASAPVSGGVPTLGVPGLEAGTWDVRVELTDVSGDVAYSGTSTVGVAKDSRVSLVVAVSAVGTGTKAGGSAGNGGSLVLMPFSHESKPGSTRVSISWGQAGTPVTTGSAAAKVITAGQRQDMAMRELDRELLNMALRDTAYDGVAAKGTQAEGGESMAVKRAFWVLESGSWRQVNATLRGTGTHAAAYVDDTCTTLGGPAIRTLLDNFDADYAKVTATFGSEPNPGIDKDPRVVILFTPLVTNYFTSANLFTQRKLDKENGIGVHHSNECEMVYIDTPDQEPTPSQLDWASGAIVHEFQHMVNFNRHMVDKTNLSANWLNEGLSMLAEGYTGHYGSVNGVIKAYLDAPHNGSALWFAGVAEDYGASYLLLKWFMGAYPQSVIRDFVGSTDGISIMKVISGTGMDRLMPAFGSAVFNDSIAGTSLRSLRPEGPATVDIAYPGTTIVPLRYGSLRYLAVPKWKPGDLGYTMTPAVPGDGIGIEAFVR